MTQIFNKSGKTPLIKIEELCRKFDLPNLLIKDESQNHFGTWKDRRSELIIKRALQSSINTLCLITSGNAGFSLAMFAQESGIQVTSIIDAKLPASIKDSLQKASTKIVETDLSAKVLSTEEIIELAKESPQENLWDVTNGFEEAYEPIIQELAEKAAPDYIICPIGSGEAFVGLSNGLAKANWKTKLIGVLPESSSSLADKLNTSWTPYSSKLEAIVKTSHQIVKLNEVEIQKSFDLAKTIMKCEPSSALVLGALEKLKFEKNAKIVIINSGQGLI